MIKLEQLTKTYTKGKLTLNAVSNLNLTIDTGEYIAIIGSSGSGKSTLLNILGLLDQPSSGAYYLNDQLVGQLGDLATSALRNQTIGFVFQSFHLIPERRAWQNVVLPLEYRVPKLTLAESKKLALEALKKVGLLDRAEHYPAELSGGQEQRVAIARALVGKPTLILADEPTGNLDAATGLSILELLESLCNTGATLIIVTHDPNVAAHAKRQIELRDGQIIADTRF